MSKYRRAARTDNNQTEIVKALRSIPGVSVELNHDDIIVGRNGVTYWYEIKSELAVSKRTGGFLVSGIKKSQKRLRDKFTGHYKIVSSLDEILHDMGIY